MNRLLALLVLLVMLQALPSSAQSRAETTGDRQSLDRVRVKLLDSKNDISGTLVKLTPDTVTILVDDRQVTVPLLNVRRVDVGGDSVSNGALIGAVVVGLWCALICGQGLDGDDSAPAAVLINAALGALIGAGIDAARSNRRTIYPSPRHAGGARQLRPALRVSVRF